MFFMQNFWRIHEWADLFCFRVVVFPFVIDVLFFYFYEVFIMSIQLSNRPLLSSKQCNSVRSVYSVLPRLSIKFPVKSAFTRQEFKDECDINIIMRRYQSTGELPCLNQATPQFLDVSASMQFQDSMNFIAGAQSMFNQLPSSVRDRFRNDPVQFLDFCSNDANRLELAKMGLLSPDATRAAFSAPPPATPTAIPSDPLKPPPVAD